MDSQVFPFDSHVRWMEWNGIEWNGYCYLLLSVSLSENTIHRAVQFILESHQSAARGKIVLIIQHTNRYA